MAYKIRKKKKGDKTTGRKFKLKKKVSRPKIKTGRKYYV